MPLIKLTEPPSVMPEPPMTDTVPPTVWAAEVTVISPAPPASIATLPLEARVTSPALPVTPSPLRIDTAPPAIPAPLARRRSPPVTPSPAIIAALAPWPALCPAKILTSPATSLSLSPDLMLTAPVDAAALAPVDRPTDAALRSTLRAPVILIEPAEDRVERSIDPPADPAPALTDTDPPAPLLPSDAPAWS